MDPEFAYSQDSEGKYQFKLVFHQPDGYTPILEWKQSSWLTDPYITGFEEMDIPPQTAAEVAEQYVFNPFSAAVTTLSQIT